MTDRQDRQGAFLSRQLQQALETIVVERPDDRAGQPEGDRLQQEILSGVTNLHVHISGAAASVLSDDLISRNLRRAQFQHQAGWTWQQ